MPVSRLFRLKIPRRFQTASVAGIFFLIVTTGLWSQSSPAQPQTPSAPQQPATPAQPQNPPQPGDSQSQSPGATVQDQQQGTESSQNADQGSDQAEPEGHITKQQAKDLFRSVDEILGFVSGDTGLPIEHKVNRRLITRAMVEKYVDKRMKDDKDQKRMEQAGLVLQKFGLLPATYDLHAEFLKLMAEQVAAYYDPKTKTVNMLDWLPPDAQKPVLAHELTHALQDQQVPLDKWELAGAKDDAALPDQQEYFVEEAQSARQCVTEGQAQVVWFDYMLAPQKKDILTAPEFVEAVRAAMGDSKDSPVFSDAPIFLKETLLMPYTFGLDFVRTVLANKGKEAAFAGLLKDPPVDTRQIMQPETYLMHQVVPQLTIPNLDQVAGPNYTRIDFGGMGEFDVYLLAKQYGVKDPPNYFRHWRGGYYYAAQARNGPKDRISLLYFSRWDSPEAARGFARIYADYTPKRYSDKVNWTSTCPPANGSGAATCNLIAGTTKEGRILIEQNGSDLLIMEGYDDLAVTRARDVLFFNMSLPAPAKDKNSK